MPLIDRHLPDFQFRERHGILIRANASEVMSAVLAYRPDSDPLFAKAIALREWPVRLRDRIQNRTSHARKAFGMENFTLLERRGDEEVVYGMAGRFWEMDYGQAPLADAAAFAAYHAPGAAKLVLNFALIRRSDDQVALSTETRVSCLDKAACRRFALYWYAIRPVSGLIRRRALSALKRQAEQRRPGPD